MDVSLFPFSELHPMPTDQPRQAPEMADRPGQRRRSSAPNIGEVRSILVRTHSIREVQRITASRSALQFARSWLTYCEPARPFAPREVHWYWGAGTVSKSAQSLIGDLPDDTYWIQCSKNSAPRCWNAYDGQKTVVFEDVTRQFCRHVDMCLFTDAVPFRVLNNHGSRQARFDKVFVVSREHPADLWEEEKGGPNGNKGALVRRVNHVYHVF